MNRPYALMVLAPSRAHAAQRAAGRVSAQEVVPSGRNGAEGGACVSAAPATGSAQGLPALACDMDDRASACSRDPGFAAVAATKVPLEA